MKKRRIRPLALGLIFRNDQILVSKGFDSKKGEVFWRPLGGGIEFGEFGYEAVKREFMEEIQAELSGVELVGCLENIFEYEGEPGHEIVMIFTASFANAAFYEREVFDVIENSVSDSKAYWMPIEELRAPEANLYPRGLAPLLEKSRPDAS